MGNIAELLNTAMRDFVRYSGDGLPNEPVGRPLPVGDPASGQFNPPKKLVRDALLGIAGSADDVTEAAEATAADRVQTGLDVTATQANAAASQTYRDQAEVAAIAAGAPLVTTLTNPVPANDTVEILQAGPGAKVYQVVGGAWSFVGWLSGPKFDNEVALKADSSPTYGGNGTIVEAGGYRYVQDGTATSNFVENNATPPVRLVAINRAAPSIDSAPGNVVWKPRQQISFAGADGIDKDTVTYADIIALWETLRSEFPNWCTRSVLGNDESDTYPIYSYVFTPEGGFDRTVIIDAGIHGGERMNMLCAYLFFRELAETWGQGYGKSLAAARQRVRWVVVPVLNPWGLNNGYERKNSNGVDINRNFDFRWSLGGSTTPTAIDYRGPSAESEAETQILVALADAYPDALAAVSLHDYIGPNGPTDSAIFFPDFTVPRSAQEISSLMRQLEMKEGISLSVFQSGNPSAFNMYGMKGMNSCNPEWAFNFTPEIYGSDDVTAALTFYGNLFIAHAFSIPAKAASARGPRVYKVFPNFANFYLDAAASGSVFEDIGGDFTIDVSEINSGIMKCIQTFRVTSAIGLGGPNLVLNNQVRFGQDGAIRGGWAASGGATSGAQLNNLAPGESKTIHSIAAGFYSQSNQQLVRYRPQIGCRRADSVVQSDVLLITSFETTIWLHPSDGSPAMDVWRLSAIDGVWEKHPPFA